MAAVERGFFDWLKRTSIRGANRLASNDETPSWKKFWACMILLGTIGSLVNIVYLSTEYWGYPYVTQLKEFVYYSSPEETELYVERHFPALTVCNLKALSSTSKLPKDTLSFPDYLALVQNNLTDVDFFKSIMGEDYYNIALNRLLSKGGYFSYLGKNRAAILGQSLDNMVVSCQTLSKLHMFKALCDRVNIYQRTVNTFFNCYTFQYNASVINIRELPMGYTLTLYLDTNNKTLPPSLDRNPAEDIGMTATIHPPDQFPRVWSDGHLLEPGRHHKIAVRTQLRKRLGYPYTKNDCEDERSPHHWHSELYDLSGNKLKYSHNADTMACINEAVIGQCRCVDSSIPVVRLNSSLNHILCGDINSAVIPIMPALPRGANGDGLPGTTCAMLRLQCAQKIKERKAPGCARHSKLRCTDVEYSSDVTSALWPHPLHQLNIYKADIRNKPYANLFGQYEQVQRLIDSGLEGEAISKLVNTDIIGQNCLRLTVVVPETTAVHAVDDRKFTLWFLLSNVGGAANLWAGVSVFFIVELLVCMFCNCPHGACCSCRECRAIPIRDDFNEPLEGLD